MYTYKSSVRVYRDLTSRITRGQDNLKWGDSSQSKQSTEQLKTCDHRVVSF